MYLIYLEIFYHYGEVSNQGSYFVSYHGLPQKIKKKLIRIMYWRIFINGLSEKLGFEFNFLFKSICATCAVQIYISCSISQPFCCSRWWCYIHYSESLTQMMGCTKGLYIEWFFIMAADTLNLRLFCMSAGRN